MLMSKAFDLMFMFNYFLYLDFNVFPSSLPSPLLFSRPHSLPCFPPPFLPSFRRPTSLPSLLPPTTFLFFRPPSRLLSLPPSLLPSLFLPSLLPPSFFPFPSSYLTSHIHHYLLTHCFIHAYS